MSLSFQAWILEHFPTIGLAAIPNADYDETMPRIKKWIAQQSHENSEYTYRMFLERVTVEHVISKPYKSDHRQFRPFAEVSFYSGYLRYGIWRRPYLPDRVLRQFGYIQSTPQNPPIGAPPTEEIDDNFRHWHLHVLNDETRGQPITSYGECAPGYFDWLHRVSHPFLLPTSVRWESHEALIVSSLTDCNFINNVL